MELEELKSIWKGSVPVFEHKDEREIATMLRGKSVFIIDKLKRSVWFELVFTVIVGVGLLVYALTLPSGALKWTSVSILGTTLLYTFLYVKKLMILNRFNPGNNGVRDNLVMITNTLTGYVKFYKRSVTILYPIFFCLSLLFVGIERGAEKFFENITRPAILSFTIFMAVVYYFLSTKFTNWFLKKLYGNHIEKLKSLLNDIHG
ncbi:MAG: hypothetical protein ABIS36_07065 [Chryseolinea sp.]